MNLDVICIKYIRKFFMIYSIALHRVYPQKSRLKMFYEVYRNIVNTVKRIGFNECTGILKEKNVLL